MGSECLDWFISSVYKGIFEPHSAKDMDTLVPHSCRGWRDYGTSYHLNPPLSLLVPIRSRIVRDGFLYAILFHLDPGNPGGYDGTVFVVIREYADNQEARRYATNYKLNVVSSAPEGICPAVMKSTKEMIKSGFLGEETYLDHLPVAYREVNNVLVPVINGVVINNFIISDFNGPLFALEAIPLGSTLTSCLKCDLHGWDQRHLFEKCSTLKKTGKMHREDQEALVRLIFAAVKAVKPKKGPFKDIIARISEIQKELRSANNEDLVKAAQQIFKYETAEIEKICAARQSPPSMENLVRIFDEFYLLRMQLRANLSLKEKPFKRMPGYKWAGRRITKLSETWAQDIQLKNWSGDKMLPDVSEKKDTLTNVSETSLVKDNITKEDMIITDYYVPE